MRTSRRPPKDIGAFTRRLYPVRERPVIGYRLSTLAKWAGKLVGGVPPQIFEVLRSPGVAILFLAVCLALSLRRPLAIGVLVAVSFLAVLLGVTREDFGSRLWYFAGVVAFAGALALQYHDPDERHFWTKVYERLKGDRAVRGDLELKYRLLQRLRREGRPLAESECLGAVARALGRETEDPQVLEATGRVARQLVVQDALTVIHNTAQGKMLAPVPELLEHKRDTFTFIAGVPKAVVVGLIALLWVIMPVDIIPDAIPIVGVLDDVIVSILGTLVITNTLRSVQARREQEGVL